MRLPVPCATSPVRAIERSWPYPPGLEYIASLFGCLYAGVVAVPAYPPRVNRPNPRLRAIVADTGATVALTCGSVHSRLDRYFAKSPELQTLNWLNSDDIPDASGESWTPSGTRPHDLAILQYTSGSTGTPKGVMLSHRHLLNNQAMINQAFEMRFDERSVCWLPPYHDMGLIGGLFQVLYTGASTWLMSPAAFVQRPVRWLEAISRFRARVSGGPNFAYDHCVQKITPEERASLDLSSWMLAYNGAEPVSADTLNRFVETFAPHGFRRETFYPCYGLAEATLIVSGGRRATEPVVRQVPTSKLRENDPADVLVNGADTQRLVGSGRPLSPQDVRVVDPQTCVPVNDGCDRRDLGIRSQCLGGILAEARGNQSRFRRQIGRQHGSCVSKKPVTWVSSPKVNCTSPGGCAI